MLSTRDIKRKIRSVGNIEQICRAMKAVSSVKLRRAQQRIRGARPYADHMSELLYRFAAGGAEHPYFQPRPVRAVGLIVITADKGLAGGFNVNIIRGAVTACQAAPAAGLITIGRKGTVFFTRRRYDVRATLSPMGSEPDFLQIAPLADTAARLFLEGAWDQVRLIYSAFRGGARTEIAEAQVLPIRPPRGMAPALDLLCEPPAAQILGRLLPRYLRTVLFTAVLDSVASEHAARVAAMTQATNNAEDMIRSLTLDYNKARQAGITGELLDIVGTAEALR
jgi:F-type H+-transporting ATPase subunit gamma